MEYVVIIFAMLGIIVLLSTQEIEKELPPWELDECEWEDYLKNNKKE